MIQSYGKSKYMNGCEDGCNDDFRQKQIMEREQ